MKNIDVVRHGERSSECASLGNLGWVSGMQGDFQAARSYHEQALLLSREIGNLYLEVYTLINLSAITGMMGEAQSSLDYSQKSLELSRKTGDRSAEHGFLCGIYRLLLDISASRPLQRSIAIRDELGQPGMMIESLAGLIQAFLRKDDHASALTEAEKIMSYLDAAGTLEGTEEPLRVYYACYLALEKAADARSHGVLQSAVRLLEAQVSKLRDDSSRQMYIENVPWRLAIRQLSHE
jgi:tetratricopeptide (TPR) repeat protein